VTVAQWLDLIKGLPLHFTPGTSFHHSNTNYFLLGYIIERVSGQPYTSYLQHAIFAPLLLQHTGYDTNHPDPRTHARGYAAWNTPAQYTDMSWWLGSGALYSNVIDLWHWDEALMNNILISKASTTDMLAPHVAACNAGCGYPSLEANYSDGWSRSTLDGHLIINHGGDLTGFTTMNEFMPNDGITICLAGAMPKRNAFSVAVDETDAHVFQLDSRTSQRRESSAVRHWARLAGPLHRRSPR
jgi:CubicO group peptidase (beta-lactamase class C family)